MWLVVQKLEVVLDKTESLAKTSANGTAVLKSLSNELTLPEITKTRYHVFSILLGFNRSYSHAVSTIILTCYVSLRTIVTWRVQGMADEQALTLFTPPASSYKYLYLTHLILRPIGWIMLLQLMWTYWDFLTQEVWIPTLK